MYAWNNETKQKINPASFSRERSPKADDTFPIPIKFPSETIEMELLIGLVHRSIENSHSETRKFHGTRSKLAHREEKKRKTEVHSPQSLLVIILNFPRVRCGQIEPSRPTFLRFFPNPKTFVSGIVIAP